MHSHFGAPAGSGYDFHCTAAAFDSADNRFADAQPVRRNCIDIKSFAVVAHEHFDRRICSFAVEGDRLAAMGDGIDQRLTRGVQQRIGLDARMGVAHSDHLNRFAMFVLNLGGDLLQPGADGTIRCGTFLIQPFAQLAFLPARQGEHSGGGLQNAVG